jgi:hypothetical protein
VIDTKERLIDDVADEDDAFTVSRPLFSFPAIALSVCLVDDVLGGKDFD